MQHLIRGRLAVPRQDHLQHRHRSAASALMRLTVTAITCVSAVCCAILIFHLITLSTRYYRLLTGLGPYHVARVLVWYKLLYGATDVRRNRIQVTGMHGSPSC